MPLNAVLGPDDLKRGEIATPGWWPAEFTDYEEKPAETDGSTNIYLSFKVIDGPNKGISVRKLFNEKALGFGKALWKVFGFGTDAQGNLRITEEMIRSKIGSKLQIYIKTGVSNKGNSFNDVQDYRPL